MLLCFLVATSHGFAQTAHYVSTDGNDSWDGNSVSTPWKTISNVNSVPFVSGDAIFFRCGDVFQGQLDVRQSGITLGSYGSGQRPIITGAVQLTGWSRYGLFYVAKASATVKNLFANGVQMTLARSPNSGFLPVATSGSATTLTATGINQSSGYWNGANLRVRTSDYSFETRIISSFDGTTITLASAPLRRMKAGEGFYLDNTLAALDSAGEWYCDPATNSVYFWAPGDVDPNTMTVEGSFLDYGVNSSLSNITVQGLEFRCQARAALRFSGAASEIRILSNTVFGGFVNGIQFDGTAANCTIDGNTVQQINGIGITFMSARNSTISRNRIRDVGLVQGYDDSGNLADGMIGICFANGSGAHNTITDNIIDSVGYIGIQPNGSYNLVENNVITNTMLKKSDGGAIYNYNDDGLTFGNTIRNNFIRTVVGNIDGTPPNTSRVAHGIYLDYGCHDMIVQANTVIHACSDGIFIQYNASAITCRNNVLYESGNDGLELVQDTTMAYGKNTIKGNIFYPLDITPRGYEPWLIYIQQNKTAAILHSPGTIDSNYYCNPYGKSVQFRTVIYDPHAAMTAYSLAQWNVATGQDAHSKDPWKFLTAPAGMDSLFVNATATEMIADLGPFAYRDLDGNSVTGNLHLPPYSSKILIKDGFAKNKPPPAGNGSVHRLNYLILGQNYPNPFNPLTDISYHLPIDAKVRLDVFDSIGRMVARLVDENQKTGDYQAAFTNPGLASGVYFYRLSAGAFTETKKMLLIK